MIVCIHCSAETKKRMDGMLGEDEYRDYSELIAVAVENLWLLDREVTARGSFVIGEGLAPPPKSTEPEKAAGVRKPTYSSPRKRKTVVASSVSGIQAPVSIPDLFLRAGLRELSTSTSAITPPEGIEELFTLDRWLFGQYNRLLPLKASSRALLRIAAEHPDGVPLEEAAPRIAEAAAMLGDYLADHDRRHQIGRDDALATAFSRSGPDAEKSRARYATHFVGSTNSRGVLSGLLCEYRLAMLGNGDDPRLMPTEPAVQFARMTNPVLDSCQTDPTQKFSPEETAFILDHVRSHVPVENFAFRTLIKAIADGANKPLSLDEALSDLVPVDTNRSLSPSFLTSQRSGALSRMADLGLIDRLRKGVKVSYRITGEGNLFLEMTNDNFEKEDEVS